MYEPPGAYAVVFKNSIDHKLRRMPIIANDAFA